MNRSHRWKVVVIRQLSSQLAKINLAAEERYINALTGIQHVKKYLTF